MRKIKFWYCEECEERWDGNPGWDFCPECEDNCIRSKIIPFTREESEEIKAEHKAEQYREDREDE